MASIKPSSRYNNNNNSTTSSFFTTTSNISPRSSAKSDPSSSTEHLYSSSSNSSRATTAIVKTNDRRNTPNNNNFSSLVKRLIETKSNTSSRTTKKGSSDPVKLVVAADYLAENLKKPTSGGGKNGSFFHKKLFKVGSKGDEPKSDKKALTEVKANTRTLAMVLRSERELMSSNKELEALISELKLTLEDKNREVDKLKDLCLKQRDEIKSLKSAILFPDVMNSQLEQLLEKQGSELKQAKQLIPSLQEQVSSLTGQLQCIAVDLAEVKADKYSMRGFCDAHNSSPRALTFDQDDDAANSLDFSSSSHTPVGSPDDLFLKDLNPCLTPNDVRKKMEESEKYDSAHDERPFRGNYVGFEGCARKLSISSDYHRQRPKTSSSRPVRVGCRSDESKATLGKHQNRF